MLGHLTIHNLFKFCFEDIETNLVKIFQRAMTTHISKSAVDFFVLHCCSANLNKTSIRKLAIIITSGIVITFFNHKLLFYIIWAEVKMTKKPYWQLWIDITISDLWKHADVERNWDNYTTFCVFCYCIFYVY